MINVKVYIRNDCHLCEQVLADLHSLQDLIPHEVQVVDVDTDRDLLLEYGLEIPVVEIGPYKLKAPITRQELHATMGAAADRQRHLDSLQTGEYRARLFAGAKITRADRFSYWLSNHYMALFNLIVIVYLGLPFLAPALMVTGAEAPARLIYRLYGNTCHQFAFRSFFLFGEQSVYPRAAAGLKGLETYGQASGLDENDVWAARQFLGNPTMGYKLALCERDIAMWAGILVFGLLFVLVGRGWKSLPFLLWVLIGIVPIGIDGFTQILSQPPVSEIFNLHLLPFRESTPFLRVLTGGLFGLTTAWYGYPLVEQSMLDTRRFMAEKFALVRAAGGPNPPGHSDAAPPFPEREGGADIPPTL